MKFDNLPFVAKIEKGNLIHDFPERFAAHLAKLEGKRVTVEIKKFHKTRTIPQLRYLRGYVLPIAAAFMSYNRYERDRCYNVLKSLFLKTNDEFGREYVRSLAGDAKDPVNTKLMVDFTDQIRKMVSIEYFYDISDPDKHRIEDVEDIVREIESSA